MTLKKWHRFIPLIIPALFVSTTQCIAQDIDKKTCIDIQYKSDILYQSCTNNATALTTIDFNTLASSHGTGLSPKEEEEKVTVTIYYRFDNDKLDRLYLSNANSLSQIDSIMKLKSANYIDSLRIVAYSSPEGSSSYNQQLSERRAHALKDYLITTYPQISQSKISTEARGANWEGLLQMVEADPNLPMKEEVLAILNNPSTRNAERQRLIERLDGGRVYKNYIVPNYYRYLRGGVSLFRIYNPEMPEDVDNEAIEVNITDEPVIAPVITRPEIAEIPEPIYGYPVALRTNLLYDVIGGLNIGVEVPLSDHWSWMADIAYANWHTSNEKYALKTMEYGTEFRYWFKTTEAQKARNSHWKQPLKGWNIGAYFRYWNKYDVQWVDGYQGDDSWSAGLTVGYSLPLCRALALEFSLGGGYFSTKEYRHYHQPEIDKNNAPKLMWQETGKWQGLTLSKARVSLIWLIQYTKK